VNLLPLARRSRCACIAALFAAALLGRSPHCAAQSCHDAHTSLPSPQSSSAKLGLQVRLSSEHAAFDTERYAGNYEALGLLVRWSRSWGDLRAASNVYRINANGRLQTGPGDFMLGGQWRAAEWQDGRLQLSADAQLHLPSDESNQHLSMGHPMVMPGLWLNWDNRELRGTAGLSYAQALGTHPHHSAHGPAPLVNPMNAQELETAASVGTWLLGRWLRTRVGASFAAPLSGPAAARGTASLALDAVFSALFTGVETHTAWLGDPFSAKLRLFVGFNL
jgi:hypothetical protein